MSVEEEIGQMIDSIEGQSEESVDEKHDDEKEAKGEEDKGKEVEEKTEESKADSDTSDKEVVEEKEEVEKVTEPDDKDKVIDSLRTKLSEIEDKAEPKVEAKVEEPKADEKFLKDIDLDDLTREPEKFEEVLDKVYRRAVRDSNMEVLAKLPDLVKTHITVTNELKAASDNFYAENEDLKKFPKVVQTVFDELASADPKAIYKDVIAKVGPEVRKRLELPTPTKSDKKEVKSETKNDVRPPKPAGSRTGGRTSQPRSTKSNALQDEIEAMNTSLGR